jgi:hypothetical protein
LEERREGLLTSIQASDRFGRKPVLVISLLGMTVASTLFGMSQKLWQMVLFRCVAGVFGGTVVTVRAMLSENSTKHTQARAFSFFAFASNMGIFIGPLIGMHPKMMYRHQKLTTCCRRWIGATSRKIPLNIRETPILPHLPLRPPEHRDISHRSLRGYNNHALRQRNTAYPPQQPKDRRSSHVYLETHQIPRSHASSPDLQLRLAHGIHLHRRLSSNPVYAHRPGRSWFLTWAYRCLYRIKRCKPGCLAASRVPLLTQARGYREGALDVCDCVAHLIRCGSGIKSLPSAWTTYAVLEHGTSFHRLVFWCVDGV